MLHHVVQLMVTGILQGGILALLSVGLSLIFGVVRVANFAQADFMMLGMYAVFFAAGATTINSTALAIAMFVPFFFFGGLLYVLIIRRVNAAKDSLSGVENAQLMVTLAISLIVQNGMLMAVGANPRTLTTGQILQVWSVLGVTIDKPRVVGFIIASVLGIGLLWMLRTGIGRGIRAAADDAEAAAYCGVDVGRAYAASFAIAVGLAAVAGGILVSYYPAQPMTGMNFILLMFTAVLLGGLGNVAGALMGGLILGLLQSLSGLILPYQLSNLVVFGIFLIVLFFRPNGIFGKAQRV
ncbi:MAG: branched-chain amino acid ABC transporter permease [Candidatus Velthaea sp.]